MNIFKKKKKKEEFKLSLSDKCVLMQAATTMMNTELLRHPHMFDNFPLDQEENVLRNAIYVHYEVLKVKLLTEYV